MAIARTTLLARYRALVRDNAAFPGQDPAVLARKAAQVTAHLPSVALRGPLDDGQVLFLQVASSDAVQRMPIDKARRLMECLAGDGRLLLPRLQATVDALLAGNRSVTQTATALAQLMASFPHDAHMVPVRIGALAEPRSVTLERPRAMDFAFERTQAAARSWRVRVGGAAAGGVVEVVVPRQIKSGYRAPSIRHIAAALAALPAVALRHVTRVVVEPAPDRDRRDALMARDSGNVLRLYPQRDRVSREELSLRLAHEVGHAVAAALWGEADRRGALWQPWRDAIKADGIAPSGYAHERAAEDFAEMFSLFVLARGADRAELTRLFPTRCAILNALWA